MGKFRLRGLFALAGLACALAWSGCSSNSALSITLTPAATSAITINQGQLQAIAAAVSNDPSNEGVTWSLSGGGTLINPTKTSVTYQAPATLTGDTTASVTATSVANTSITAGLSITVDSVLTITTTSLPVGALGVPYFGVVNAGGATGTFSWAQTSGTLPAGLSLSSSTSDSIVISGTPTALGASTFTLQVTDSSGTVASQSLSITINPAPPLSVATRSLSAGTVGASYSQTLQAASGKTPYTWAITAGSLPAGLGLTGAVISGIPTTAGTSNFTVQVTDSTTPTPQTASAGLSITVNPSTANNAELDGNYAFLVSGFSPNGQFLAAGSFVADGAGSIVSGIMDTNDPSGPQVGLTFTGTYSIGSNNLGTMALTVPLSGVRTFAMAVQPNGNAKIIEFDDKTGTGTRNSGVLLKQTPGAFSAAQILGNYAFGFSGADAAGARYALAGAMQADGVSHFTNGLLDSNDAGVTQNVAFTGTYTGIDSTTGRGTATISITGQGTTSYSFYIVSATQLLLMEIDQAAGQVSGSMLQQALPFGSSSLSATSVLQTSAISGSGGGAVTQSQVGLFTGDGVVNFTVNTDENTGSIISAPSCTGTYSSIGTSTGRTTLTYSGTACAESVLYMVSTNQAFVMGTDANVTFGFMENQSGPFTTASLSGTYAGGSIATVLPGAGTQVDIEVADGVSAVNFTTDSSTSGGLGQNLDTSGTYSLPTGTSRGTITVGGIQTEIFYMVSPTEFISLFKNADATIESFQQ
ncbi:MAG: putative Ig domain-containing protein [Terriglobales bacterium]